MELYPDIDEHIMDLWKLISYAARYGHQPMEHLMCSTSALITSFNNGLMFWLEKEAAGTKTGVDHGR